ncbi:MAG: VanZ family protein [bacterium]|nr:VanZ family protein [bacterium]
MPHAISDKVSWKGLPIWVYKHCIALLVIWALTIFALCAVPGEYIPSEDWMELLSLDKLVHAGIFFILACLFFIMGIKLHHKEWIIYVYVALCMLYGLALEMMQATLFRNRSADWKDMIANTCGCCAALFLLGKLRKFYSGTEVTSAYK